MTMITTPTIITVVVVVVGICLQCKLYLQDMKELDELKEKCIQAMKDLDAFVAEQYEELCNEIREQWNVPVDWIVKIDSNCGVVHGCFKQTNKNKWFRVIYNNGIWLNNNFL